MGSSGSYEDLFLANLGLVDDVVRFVSRRHRLTAADAEELRSQARLKIIDDDYAVLRAFKGESSLRTYLVIVVTRLFLDDRTARWGRWRPSATATKLGATAVLLEQLVSRDGLGHDEAVESARTNHRVPESAAELHDLLGKLPRRTSRRPTDDEPTDVPDPAPGADAAVLATERSESQARVHAALRRALATLGPHERLLMRMRYEDDTHVSHICVALGEDQKRLYRTFEQLCKGLRAAMTADGVDPAEIADLLGQPGLDESGGNSAGGAV